MCDYSDIDRAVAIFKQLDFPLIIMHTISTYPAREMDLNLRMIQTLANKYSLPIGYSGHESSVTPSLVAAAIGAVAIERHITLDRSSWGTDQSASLEFTGLRNLVGSIRKINLVLGDGIKKNLPEEREVAKKLRYWNS
jgi:N-acetylneuraminate synthase